MSKYFKLSAALCSLGWAWFGNVAHAQALTTLYSFCAQSGCPDGNRPYAGLVQGINGDLYGTTSAGGAYANADGNGGGTIFKITPSGTLTTLYSFCAQSGCPDGETPQAVLVQATNGDLYGTTYSGGAYGSGTVFKITPGGTLTTLHSFCSVQGVGLCPDGSEPSGLVQASNGYLYGTTAEGGEYGTSNGGGTIFKITPSGTLTTLHSFCAQSGCPDGSTPSSGLIQATNGNLYGMTAYGGAYGGGLGGGTIIEITPSGTLTTLYSFCTGSVCKENITPEGGLVQAANGDLYGTTNYGSVSPRADYGTVFKITLSGILTTLHSFCGQIGCPGGAYPRAGLLQLSNGVLYGATAKGGIGGLYNGSGTIYKIIPPNGTFTSVYQFCDQMACDLSPQGLMQDTNGDVYGTTLLGGAYDTTEGNYAVGGAIFRLSVGLGPFVKTLTTSGTVGTAVTILGTDLTGATGVTFNGTPAAFTVVSASEIATAVPTGASTGAVQVTTPTGTLASNVAFRVE